MKALVKNTKNRGMLTLSEIKELFSDISLWSDNYFIYTMNLLAVSTGMRLGEIQALRVENIHDEYIHVCYSYERGGRTVTKVVRGENQRIFSCFLHVSIILYV